MTGELLVPPPPPPPPCSYSACVYAGAAHELIAQAACRHLGITDLSALSAGKLQILHPAPSTTPAPPTPQSPQTQACGEAPRRPA